MDAARRGSVPGSTRGATARLSALTAVVPGWWVGGLVVLGLVILSPLYGFHRDELYFVIAGRHPALGYLDQPPLTPLLSAIPAAILGASPAAIRILPALAVGACVILAGLMARELGGTRRAQVLATAVAAVSGLLAAGHLDSTATFDLLAWAIALWLIVRLLAGASPRLWLATGLVIGIGLENKNIILFLGAGVAAGLVLARRWDVVRSPFAWAGLALAMLVWAPNLAWQAAHGFPQLEMARHIGGGGLGDQLKVIPELLLLAGPLLFPVSIAGAWWFLRAKEAAPWRVLGYAVVVVLALVIATGGKSYYAAGFLTMLFGAGGVVLDRWLARGRPGLRRAVAATAGALSFVIAAVLVLPILPPAVLATTAIPSIYKESAEQIGWPELARTVESVVASLPAADRGRAAILTANYGEAGALELLGTGLPPVYSGHNSYGEWGPPPDGRSVAIVIGHWDSSYLASRLGPCVQAASIDNGIGLDNEEQGAGVWVCRELPQPWSTLWPRLTHLD